MESNKARHHGDSEAAEMYTQSLLHLWKFAGDAKELKSHLTNSEIHPVFQFQALLAFDEVLELDLYKPSTDLRDVLQAAWRSLLVRHTKTLLKRTRMHTRSRCDDYRLCR